MPRLIPDPLATVRIPARAESLRIAINRELDPSLYLMDRYPGEYLNHVRRDMAQELAEALMERIADRVPVLDPESGEYVLKLDFSVIEREEGNALFDAVKRAKDALRQEIASRPYGLDDVYE